MENSPFGRERRERVLSDVDTGREGDAGLTRSVVSFGKFKLLRFRGFTFSLPSSLAHPLSAISVPLIPFQKPFAGVSIPLLFHVANYVS
jgi:hypothetical protein